MNKYKIEYHDGSIGCTAILIGLISPFVIMIIVGITIPILMRIDSIRDYMTGISIFIIVLMIGGLILTTLYLFNKNKTSIKFIINDEFLDVNDGEKIIYYNKINNINLHDSEYISIYAGGYNRHFLLDIYYNETDKFVLFIYTIDKNNYDIFSKFYQELNKKYENFK
jgi:hypothetical protein